MPGFHDFHYLQEFVQIHVHWVNDAIQPSHPLLPPSLLPSIFPSIRVFSNESALHIRWPKYWASASASVLPMNIQDLFPLGLTDLISLLSKELSRVFSSTTIWTHQFCGAQPSLWSSSHICTWLLEKLQIWPYGPLLTKRCLCFLICYLGLSYLFFPGANVFWFHGCSQHPQWFWSPRKLSAPVPTVSPSICHEVMGPDAMILVFWMLF